MPLKPLSRPLAEPGGAQAHHLHDTGLELTGVTRRRPHQQASCCHLLCLPSQWLRRSRAETPEGSQPAFTEGDLVQGLNPYPSDYRTAFASSLVLYPPSLRSRLAAGLPRREDDGLTTFHGCIMDGLGPACSPVARQRRQGKGDTPAPGHVPFGSSLSAPLACWFSRRLSAVHLS
jgi:hypothetical protein